MKIRDSLPDNNGDMQEPTDIIGGSIDIVNDQGKTLFSVCLKGRTLEVSGGDSCKHFGEFLDSGITIKPVANNYVKIIKDKNETRT
jgi:hypothetical protein